MALGAGFPCMWSLTLLLDLWPFPPPILDVRELNGGLVHSHLCPQQSALGACPEHLHPGPGSSGFLGFSDAWRPGKGGFMHPLPARCTIAMATM